MAITKEERLARIHQEAVKVFDEIQAAVRDERLQCLEDRRFYSIAGAQWEGPLADQFSNKPKFEVNKIHLSVIRIINEYRNNRISVSFVSKEGDESDDLADTCAKLYRSGEERSTADEAYDNAFEEAVGGGIGAWRLRAVYEDEEDEEDERQIVLIEPIYDADSSVFFDLNAKKQDKSDATRCFVLTSMSREAYKAEYNDDPATWSKSIYRTQFDWATPNVVFVAEYYVVEKKKKTLHIFKTLDGQEIRVDESDLEDERPELEAQGAKEVRTKRIKTQKVHKYILSGNSVLDDAGYIAGTCIPIVPVYGKRWFVDNIERCMGHVRLPKDSQRLKNMQISQLGAISALGSVEKPILTPEQIAGHQQMWADDNIMEYPYLLINPIKDMNGNEQSVGPIAYTKTATVPQALAALLQITEDDMQDLLGNQQAGEQVEGNISTETAMLIQNRLDMQAFIYISNMAKAIKRSGEIWLSMAKDLFVEKGRKMRGLNENGEPETLEMMTPTLNDKTGDTEFDNDLTRAKFEVTVEVGPSSSTKRAATVRSLSHMIGLTDDPETKQVLGSMAMMNMEGEGIADVRRYFRRKLIKLGVVKPSDQEAQELIAEAQNTPPSAQDKYLESAAAHEQASAEQQQASTLKTMADADQSKAKTLQMLAGVDTSQLRDLLDIIDRLGPQVVPSGLTGQPGETQPPAATAAVPAQPQPTGAS